MSSRNNWGRLAQDSRIRQQGTAPAREPELSNRWSASRDVLRREADRLLASGGVNITRSREVSPPASVPAADVAVPAGLVIYADGACEPNPGAGGWGFVVYRDGQEIHSGCGGERQTTNQRMELTAVLQALNWLSANLRGDAFRLISDSMYTINGSNEWRHGWKRNGWNRGGPNAKPENRSIANLDLWKALDDALGDGPVKLEWVRGHSGIAGNERADQLSLMGRAFVVDDRTAEGSVEKRF